MINYVEPIKKTSDINRLIQYLKEKDYKYCVIFIIGIYSGLRISDILNLNIRDVENKTEIEVREKKTKKYKKFPLNVICQKYIKEWLKIRKTQVAFDSKEPLFVGKKHCRLDRSQVWRTFVKACSELCLDGNYGTHTMRKTFGYHHYQRFHDIAMLQKIFNHSTPQITLRYIGVEQEEINQSYKDFHYDNNDKNIELPNKKQKNKPIETNNIVQFLKNYLNSGGIRHKEFAELALANL